MLPYPDIDPVIFGIGPLQVRWYGVMYVLGFSASFLLIKQQLKSISFEALATHFENLNITLILSLIVGGRLGYVTFYNLPYYLDHPLEIPATWSGGMSFHGAVIGMLIGGALFSWRKKIDFWKAADIYAVTIPIGLGLGRLGNFINGELFGRPTELPWGMVFPLGGPQARHPSQLYEMLLEGALLFFILWSLRTRPWRPHTYWPHGSLLALFFIGYGIARSVVECFREPDPQIGFFFNMMTMGQLLSIVMIIGGTALWLFRIRRRR